MSFDTWDALLTIIDEMAEEAHKTPKLVPRPQAKPARPKEQARAGTRRTLGAGVKSAARRRGARPRSPLA